MICIERVCLLKDPKDPNHIKSEHRKVTADNRILRRQNNRLQKELTKLKRMINQMSHLDEYQEFLDKQYIEEPPTDTPKCPDCGSSKLASIDLGIQIYTVCEGCKWRERQPPKA